MTRSMSSFRRTAATSNYRGRRVVNYLTFGGIYREVNLRIVPALYIENMVARAIDPLTDQPSLEVECFFDSPVAIDPHRYSWRVELRDGDRVLAKEDAPLKVASPQTRSGSQTIALKKLGSIQCALLRFVRKGGHPELGRPAHRRLYQG